MLSLRGLLSPYLSSCLFILFTVCYLHTNVIVVHTLQACSAHRCTAVLEFDLDALLNFGRDANGSLEILKEIGVFTVGTGDIRRVDNMEKGTHSLTFNLTGTTKDGKEVNVLKFAKLRSNASLNAPQYKVYLAKLTSDLKDDKGNFYKNDKGEDVGQKGSMDFYAESIGGDPRPAKIATASADTTTAPFGG